MNFLLDENFPKSATPVLQQSGHRVFDLHTLELVGAPDEVVMKLALEKSAVILSTDRDFFHTMGRRYPEHHGIVVIALRQPTRHLILGRPMWLLDHIPSTDPAGRTFQLRDQTWMVYPPL